MSRYRGSSVIVAAGGILLIAALAHHLGELRQIDQVAGPVAALVLNAGVAAGLVCAGWWLRRTGLSDAEEWPVAVYTLLGAFVGTGVEALILTVHVIEGRPVGEAAFHLLVAASTGALMLFVVGYYSASRRAVIRRYESLLNNALQFTGLLKPDGTVVEVNDTALEFGGFERDEVVGEQFTEMPWWTHSEAVHERVSDAVERAASGEFVRYETDVRGVDGLSTIDFSTKPVLNGSGEVTRIVVEGRDITRQKQQRQHLQVLHRVMRHNIRNDIMKLRMWTREAITASAPEKRDACASRVMAVLDSWEKLTTDLKHIRDAIDSEETRSYTKAIGPLVTDIVDTQRATHTEAEIEVTLPGTATAHVPSVARKALRRAIDNAVRANSDGTPRVDVVVSSTDSNWVEVDITDNGPGMPEPEVAVLETGEETPLTHGEGLGVWMIRMVVKQAGGGVSVSVSDEGTTLTLRLPEKQQGQPARTAAPA